MSLDRELERERYDARAKNSTELSDVGAICVPLAFRAPYIAFDHAVGRCLKVGGRVLEIGAGTGEFTGTALGAGAEVWATDISKFSLARLRQRHGPTERLATCVADMENLPFPRLSFDVVASAGALSYGDNDRVRDEIFRVLKPGGAFVCVDSLNHNPIYRVNRWWHFRRGRRSQSTLRRMPTVALIDSYATRFGHAEVEFFGSVTWLAPMIVRLLGETMAATLSDRIDRAVSVRRSAFKFVMVVRKT